MVRVGKFEKVSFNQFSEDIEDTFYDKVILMQKLKNMYDNIKLPKRATKMSAGYDIFLHL